MQQQRTKKALAQALGPKPAAKTLKIVLDANEDFFFPPFEPASLSHGQSFSDFVREGKAEVDVNHCVMHVCSLDQSEEDTKEVEELCAFGNVFFAGIAFTTTTQLSSSETRFVRKDKRSGRMWQEDIINILKRKQASLSRSMGVLVLTKRGLFSHTRKPGAAPPPFDLPEPNMGIIIRDPRDSKRQQLQVFQKGIMHMLGFKSCVYYSCPLNHAATMEHSDKLPLSLCVVCLRKFLSVSKKCDPMKRYKALEKFYAQRVHCMDDHAWVADRIKVLEAYLY